MPICVCGQFYDHAECDCSNNDLDEPMWCEPCGHYFELADGCGTCEARAERIMEDRAWRSRHGETW